MAANEAVFPDPGQPYIPEDTLASRLVQLRHGLGLTQAEAAEKCDLDDGSWSNWERGARPRDMVDVVAKITDALHVDRDWLMWGQNRKDLTPADLRLIHSDTEAEDTTPGPGQMTLDLRPRLHLVKG